MRYWPGARVWPCRRRAAEPGSTTCLAIEWFFWRRRAERVLGILRELDTLAASLRGHPVLINAIAEEHERESSIAQATHTMAVFEAMWKSARNGSVEEVVHQP
jgi:hypothetical protein